MTKEDDKKKTKKKSVVKKETDTNKDAVQMEITYGGKSFGNTKNYKKKYVVVNGEECFVGQLFADVFEDISQTIDEFIEDGFEDCIASKKDLYGLVDSVKETSRYMLDLAEQFTEPKFERDPKWFTKICDGAAKIMSRVEMTNHFYNPDAKTTNGDIYYHEIYDANKEILDVMFQLSDKYLGIKKFKMTDRGKFYPEYQQGLRLAGGENDKIQVDTLAGGYIGVDGIIKKEIVYIQPAVVEEKKILGSKKKQKDGIEK